jgi:hypothetical protein
MAVRSPEFQARILFEGGEEGATVEKCQVLLQGPDAGDFVMVWFY